MATIGLKIRDNTYNRLKWLKTRFEFVYEKSMSWDEFFEKISRDALLILAYDLREKNGGRISTEDLVSILSGSSFGNDEDLIESMNSLFPPASSRNRGVKGV